MRAIEALATRYHTLCDGGWAGPSHPDPDALADLWTPEGVYSINPRRPACRGRDQIRDQFVRLQSSMPWILHTFTNSDIEVDGDTARGVFKGTAYYRRDGGSHIVVGSYLGEFVRTDDGWRFQLVDRRSRPRLGPVDRRGRVMTLPEGPWGVWATGLRLREAGTAMEAARALEAAGYSALWMTGGASNPFERVRDLLGATSRIVVATGILSIWTMTPDEVATEVALLAPADRERFVLGLGVSHASLVDRAEPGRYGKPLSRMREYLDDLDRIDPSLARQGVLAALGPRMLDLAATRTAGAHPYLTTPEHTAEARTLLGEAPFLAPTQMIVREADPAAARQAARRHLSLYLGQPNYVSSWIRLGFSPDDVADGGSDALVDSLVAWGDDETIARRLREHLDAGADHVCVQALDRELGWRDKPFPVEDWLRLAPTLFA